MAGTQKHWIDGLPFDALAGGGSQKHWVDGLPFASAVASAAGSVSPDSIESTLAFGDAVVAGPITVDSISTGASFGEPTVTPAGVTLDVPSIASTLIVGEPSVNSIHIDADLAIGPATQFGTPQLNLWIHMD